jgi:hypothetical protein
MNNIDVILNAPHMRALDFQEFAHSIFPNLTKQGASRKLKYLINRDEELMAALTALHFKSGQRSYTPAQCEVIYQAIVQGTPLDNTALVS